MALPSIVKTHRDLDQESAELTALLRLVGSLDAYRRQYRSRAYLGRVAELMFTGAANPSSLSFCLRNLHYALKTLISGGGRNRRRCFERDLCFDRKSRGGVAGANATGRPECRGAKHVAESSTPRESWGLTARVEALHSRIEDAYFTHQAQFTVEPALGFERRACRR